MKAELQYNDSPYGLLVMTGMNSYYNIVNVNFIDGKLNFVYFMALT